MTVGENIRRIRKERDAISSVDFKTWGRKINTILKSSSGDCV